MNTHALKKGNVTGHTIDTLVSWGYVPIILDTRPIFCSEHKEDFGKLPRYKGSPGPNYNLAHVKNAAAEGLNIGARIPSDGLIIDVDPRNGGQHGLHNLERDICMSLVEHYPTVYTGGGGYHFYMTMPAGVYGRKSINGYDGIDFLACDRYVVAPGSYHYACDAGYLEDRYTFNVSSPPSAPDFLISSIQECNWLH